jgi:hypothetical protein
MLLGCRRSKVGVRYPGPYRSHPARPDELLLDSEINMTTTEENKAFIQEMIGTKKRLEDYPERFDQNLVMHEPACLPFGGTYVGLEQFQKFYPQVRDFYDFGRFELLGVYGDGDMVFATIRAGLADSDGTIFIAEQFRFEGTKLVEVRLHICDDKQAAQEAGIRIGSKLACHVAN